MDGGDLNLADSGSWLQRETAKIRRLRTNWSDSSGQDASRIEAELWEYTAMLRVVSIDGEEARPELGFRHCRESEGERDAGFFRVFLAAEGFI
jgi:hypothetical protein